MLREMKVKNAVSGGGLYLASLSVGRTRCHVTGKVTPLMMKARFIDSELQGKIYAIDLDRVGCVIMKVWYAGARESRCSSLCFGQIG